MLEFHIQRAIAVFSRIEIVLYNIAKGGNHYDRGKIRQVGRNDEP
jgi:hypothetical protein